jgi:hypothetical protein
VPEFKVVILSPPMVAQKTSRQGITDTALASGVRETGHTYIFYDRIVAVSHRYGGSSIKEFSFRYGQRLTPDTDLLEPFARMRKTGPS